MQNCRKRTLCSIVILSLAVASTSSSANPPDGLCSGKDFTLGCLKENFRELYKTNYNRFWDILYLAEKKARKCDSTRNTASFLEMARVIGGNAEVGEYFSEVIERLCTTKARCLLDALTLVDEKSKIEIVAILRNPTFLEKDPIERVFLRNRENKKYKEIMQLYFSR